MKREALKERLYFITAKSLNKYKYGYIIATCKEEASYLFAEENLNYEILKVEVLHQRRKNREAIETAMKNNK